LVFSPLIIGGPSTNYKGSEYFITATLQSPLHRSGLSTLNRRKAAGPSSAPPWRSSFGPLINGEVPQRRELELLLPELPGLSVPSSRDGTSTSNLLKTVVIT
jgi:hypothetical protein